MKRENLQSQGGSYVQWSVPSAKLKFDEVFLYCALDATLVCSVLVVVL